MNREGQTPGYEMRIHVRKSDIDAICKTPGDTAKVGDKRTALEGACAVANTNG